MDCNIETIFLQSIGIIRKEPETPSLMAFQKEPENPVPNGFPNGFPIDNHIKILYTQIIRLDSYTGSIRQIERSYTLNHLAMISIITVIAHLLWFAVMTERKYSLKKTLLFYGLYAVFFTILSLLAFSLLGKDSPYVIPFSFIGTILPAILLFLYTSSDTFCKKIFLVITYANLFCIFICISVLICDGLFLNLSTVQRHCKNVAKSPCVIAVLLFCPALYARCTGKQEANMVLDHSCVYPVSDSICNACRFSHAYRGSRRVPSPIYHNLDDLLCCTVDSIWHESASERGS